mgnify:CR=1 FL=1
MQLGCFLLESALAAGILGFAVMGENVSTLFVIGCKRVKERN